MKTGDLSRIESELAHVRFKMRRKPVAKSLFRPI